jgi:hypothetical protein
VRVKGIVINGSIRGLIDYGKGYPRLRKKERICKHLLEKSVSQLQRRHYVSMDTLHTLSSIPYSSDNFNNTVRKIFHNKGLNVRIEHKSSTLHNALKITITHKECKLTNCPMKEPTKCFQQGVVYEITCPKCLSKYIGSTFRHLHAQRNMYTTRILQWQTT